MTASGQPISDPALVRDMMAGDERALSLLYDRYSGMLYGLLMRVLRDPQAAEEVLQDVFLQLWRNGSQFDAARGSLPAWLLVIGRNKAISMLRRRTGREVLEETEGSFANTFVSPQNIEEEASRTEMSAALRDALAQLPAEQRLALELAYFEGMTQSEIATKTGSPLGTVKTRIRSAMQSLKQIVNERRTRQFGRL